MALLIGGTLAYLYLPLPWSALVIAGLAAFEGIEILFWLWLRKRRPAAGPEALVGERGVLAEGGRVRIRGTTYPARVRNGSVGDAVVIEEVDGLTLTVRRVPDDPSPLG